MTATAVLVAILFSNAGEESSKAYYERETRLDAVWTNYGKFLDVVHKAREFAFRANGAKGNLAEFPNTDTLRLSDGVQSATVDFASDFCPADLDGRNLPPHSTSANYRLLRPKRSPISELEITLGGWGGNAIKVAGCDQTQVDAANALLLNELGLVTTCLGTSGFSLLVHAALFRFAVGLFYAPLVLWKYLGWRSKVFLPWVPWLALLIILALIFSGNVARSLPLCSISDTPSWLDKYSSLFTFLGLALAILVPILGAIWGSLRHRSSDPVPAKRAKRPKQAWKEADGPR